MVKWSVSLCLSAAVLSGGLRQHRAMILTSAPVCRAAQELVRQLSAREILGRVIAACLSGQCRRSAALSCSAIIFPARRPGMKQGQEHSLTIESRAGEPAQGQYGGANLFASRMAGYLELSLIRGEDVVQGTRFPEGTLKISGGDGWRKVIPVSALAACQPAAS